MEIRSEPHFTLTIVITDEEAKDIILDPDQFLAQIQDAIAPNGDYSKRAAQSDGPARRGAKRAYKGHYSNKSSIPKIKCDQCGRMISPWKFDMHMASNHSMPAEAA